MTQESLSHILLPLLPFGCVLVPVEGLSQPHSMLSYHISYSLKPLSNPLSALLPTPSYTLGKGPLGAPAA